MSYFQNPFNYELRLPLALSDRQYSITYKLAANVNRSDMMCSINVEPFDLTTKVDFAIFYSIDNGVTYPKLSVTLTSGSSRTAQQVADDLNGNAAFAAIFTASSFNGRVMITSDTNYEENFLAYIPNLANAASPTTSAEEKLGFNKKAAVVELPSYFDRHTIANRAAYADSVGRLVKLTQADENFVITNAGLSTTPQDDYQLLKGKSGLFRLYKQTVNSSDQVTAVIEFSAGAKAGDLAKKTTYSYNLTTDKNPIRKAEVPYTLTSGDLFTPP